MDAGPHTIVSLSLIPLGVSGKADVLIRLPHVTSLVVAHGMVSSR